jgi:hypothetical protein
LAAATPPLWVAATDALAGGELEVGVDEDDPHADAAATHAVATTPIHAFCSFMAMSRLRGSGRPGSRGLPPATEVSLTRRSITRGNRRVNRFIIMITMDWMIMR